MVYTLIITVRWLHSYFQTHSVVVLTDLSLKALLQWSDTSERMAKWVVELSEFDISYHLRSSIKVQILANFIIECTILEGKLNQKVSKESTTEPTWILHVDGVSNNPIRKTMKQAISWLIQKELLPNMHFASPSKLRTIKSNTKFW